MTDDLDAFNAWAAEHAPAVLADLDVGRCGNCLAESTCLERVGGYLACEVCVTRAGVPFYMRDSL